MGRGRIQRLFSRFAAESGLERINEYVQHGSHHPVLHSLAVAYYSYRLARFTRLSLPLARAGARRPSPRLFPLRRQDGDPARKGHWTRHPHIAAENAKQEMDLTPIEEDTIRCHMFPLTIKPPKYREGVVVSLVDKACSVYEFFRRRGPIPNCAPRCPTADCNFAPSRDSGERA